MSVSVTLSNVSWSTPDGRPLLSHLDLSFDGGRTGLVGRNGVGKTTLLKLVSGELRPQAGTVSVTGTVGVLPQLANDGASDTIADLFGIGDALGILQRAEAGTATADDLAAADWTLEARLAEALGSFGLVAAPHTFLSTLSGGQRTRAGLATLAFAAPDVILLDEPTNNLDAGGRASVIGFLQSWHAGAIVVSHDRELLETMEAIVELTSLGATRYGGNWSHYRARKALDLAAARHDLADAERRVDEIERRAQANAERKARRDRAGRATRARGDIPRIQLNAMRNSAENSGGEAARLAERRRTQALEDAAAARQRIEVLQPMSIVLPSTGLPSGKVVLRVEEASVGYVPGLAVLRDLSFAITGPERMAVSGPNGSGKTTLLHVITGGLPPWAGSVQRMTPVAFLDQNVSLLDPSRSLRDNSLTLNPGADENACRAALARFAFRAEAALQIVSTLSGGQRLRAGLACVLGVAPPPLLILDEPTNHLDIDSIETVEAGLRAYDGALVVVSHDPSFLDAVGITRWLAI